MIDITEWVERAMADIRKDAAEGVIPAKPTGFQELHDYVDANEYFLHAEPAGLDLDPDEWLRVSNDVVDEIDRRLKAANS